MLTLASPIADHSRAISSPRLLPTINPIATVEVNSSSSNVMMPKACWAHLTIYVRPTSLICNLPTKN
jgi:hypothetical protein